MFWIILGIIVVALICAGSISRAQEEDRRMAAAKNGTSNKGCSTAKTRVSGRNFYTGNYNNFANDAALRESMRSSQECLNRMHQEEFVRFMDPCDSSCGYSFFNDPCNNNGFGGGFGF